jgi:nucleoid-associated protein YgaU
MAQYQFPNYSAAAFKGGPITGTTPFQSTGELAGRYGQALPKKSKAQEVKDQLAELGVDTSTPIGGALAMNFLLNAEKSDINKIKEEGEYFKGLMNEMADAAQKRAMEANVFAGIMNLPNQFSRAMAERYRYFPETMEIVAQGIRPGTSFGNRQYINL